MFDFVRSHSRLMLGLMVLLIFPSFVFFGIQGYSRFTDGSEATVAKVDGQAIKRAEWDAAHQRQVERMRRQMPALDSKFFDSPEMRRQTLNALVQERLLLAATDKLHLMPSNERLARLFRTDPNLAGARNPDGTLNRDVVASQGMSVEMFERQLRTEFGMQQVQQGIRGSAIAPASAASSALEAYLQRREVQFERFDPAAYAARVQPADAELEAYYKANTARYVAPEQAAIEYIVLDLDTLAKEVPVPEAELRTYYEQNVSRYTAAEERRASHILIKSDKDQPAAERAKAKARAEALLAEVRKNPQSFAELARKNSEDSSASQGGDLEFFARGAMVKPFEDAAFSMKTGEISNVVETDFGYHILQLTAVRGGEKKPFEAVRAEIEAEKRKADAAKLYAERAVQFNDIVFEQPDSLQPAIDKLKLTKRTATVTRTPAPDATGPLASAKFLTAIFGNDVVRNKRNSEAVETAPSQMAAGRIVKYEPTRTKAFDEVKAEVRAAVVAAQAAALARKDGAARLSAARESAATALASTGVFSRAQTQGMPKSVIDAVLAADAAKLPQVVGVDLGEQGYAVARVTKVLPPELPPGSDTLLRNQYAAAWSNVEADAYLAALKKRYKVEIKEPAVAAALAAASAASP
jgi:peptidyl-prolyl cis-trans isomerase D